MIKLIFLLSFYNCVDTTMPCCSDSCYSEFLKPITIQNLLSSHNYNLIFKYKDLTGKKWIETFPTENIHVILHSRGLVQKDYMKYVYNRMKTAKADDGYMLKDSIFKYFYGIMFNTNDTVYNYIDEDVLSKIQKIPLKKFFKKYFDSTGLLKKTPVFNGKEIDYLMVNAYLFEHCLCLERWQDGWRIPYKQWQSLQKKYFKYSYP